MDIRASFPIMGQSGWEFICRNLLLALHKLGVNVALRSKSDWNWERIPLDMEDFQRLQIMSQAQSSETATTLYQQVISQAEFDGSTKAEKKICLSLFETDKVPEEWTIGFNLMNEIWTFSDFNKNMWQPDIKVPVKKMPFAIDPMLYHKDVEPIQILNKKGFSFITQGDFTERKNFEGLLEAFVKEFTDKDDVCLIMKVHYAGFQYMYQKMLYNKIHDFVKKIRKENLPRILFFGDKVPQEEMPRYYKSGDCFVLPTRGEGLGIPIAEALSVAVPVITTGWGGQTEFCTKENSYLLPFKLKPITMTSYIRKCPHVAGHRWAEVEVNDIRKAMRHVFENREEAKQKALLGSDQMKKYTFQNQALWVIKNAYADGRAK